MILTPLLMMRKIRDQSPQPTTLTECLTGLNSPKNLNLEFSMLQVGAKFTMILILIDSVCLFALWNRSISFLDPVSTKLLSQCTMSWDLNLPLQREASSQKAPKTVVSLKIELSLDLHSTTLPKSPKRSHSSLIHQKSGSNDRSFNYF